MNKILLTGCDGFIGSYIAEDLLNEGYEVIGIDNHSKYKFPYTEHHYHSNFKFLNIDLITQIHELKSVLRNTFDITNFDIIHTAAVIGGIKKFHEEPADIILDNATIDTNILRIAKVFKCNKFIGLSSSMVYENTEQYPSKEDSVDYIAPPTSSYGFSKLTMERMIKAVYDQYGLVYNIVRPFNAIGCRENDFLEGKSSHVLPDLIIKALKSTDSLEILGYGEQIRHFTHAKDIARGIRYVLQRGEQNDTYNISSPVSTTMIELAQKIWSKIHPDKQLSLRYLHGYKYDVQKRIPDVYKASAKLGFNTKISLDDGIDEVIEYIKGKLNV